eukprot:12483440-Alexandrium_andersonii.AAC.1
MSHRLCAAASWPPCKGACAERGDAPETGTALAQEDRPRRRSRQGKARQPASPGLHQLQLHQAR